MNDDLVDGLVADFYQSQTPASVPPRARSTGWWWVAGLAAAVLVASVAGATGWALRAPAPPSTPRAADLQAPAPDEPVHVDQDGRVKTVMIQGSAADLEPEPGPEEALLGSRFDYEVDWIEGAPPRLDHDFVVVLVQPWCPHCEPGVEATMDAVADEPGLPVMVLSSLSRGATEEQFQAMLHFEPALAGAGVISSELERELLVGGGVPRALLFEDGEVVWVGHPRHLDQAL